MEEWSESDGRVRKGIMIFRELLVAEETCMRGPVAAVGGRI